MLCPECGSVLTIVYGDLYDCFGCITRWEIAFIGNEIYDED